MISLPLVRQQCGSGGRGCRGEEVAHGMLCWGVRKPTEMPTWRVCQIGFRLTEVCASVCCALSAAMARSRGVHALSGDVNRESREGPGRMWAGGARPRWLARHFVYE
jgi:hypothetical protein